MRRPWPLLMLTVWAGCRSSETVSSTTGSAAPAASAAEPAADDRSGSGSGASTGGGTATGEQTAREAIELVCDAEARSGASTAAPADRARILLGWLREHVTEREIAQIVESFDRMSRADAQRRIAEVAQQHGITRCAFVAPPALPFELPEISSGGIADDQAGPLVLVSPTEIVVEGTSVLALRAGALDATALEAGTLPRLVRFVRDARLPARVRIAFAASTPSATALAVLASLARAEVEQLAIVGRAGDLRMLVPVEVRRAGEPATTLRVSLDGERMLRLWSGAGDHGRGSTAAPPVLEVTLDGGLGQLVRGLAAARGALGSSGEAPPITVMIDGRHDVATLVRVVATVRTMFSRVYLSDLAGGSR